MKITQFHDTDKPDTKHLLLAVDVSSRRLDAYSRYRQDGTDYEIAEPFFNELPAIADRLEYYAKQARGLGYRGLSIVVEPSGRYETKLTQTAIQQGHPVWMVNPEHMYKAGVIHHGDDGKSDPLDGKVLYMMGRMGKASRLIPLPADWQQLRQLGKWLDDCTLIACDLRIRIGTLRRKLFTDYRQRSDLSWGATGQAIQRLYGFDPWEITADTYSGFISRVKAHRRGVPERCLAGIWSQAKSSCSGPKPPTDPAMDRQQLDHLWTVWQAHQARKKQIAAQMITLVDGLDL